MRDKKTGHALLFDALWTKGTAFTREERREFGLLGLLPTAEKTLAQQAEHCWNEFCRRRDPIDKHIYLRALQDRNETLFYRVLREHVADMMPIVFRQYRVLAAPRYLFAYTTRNARTRVTWTHAAPAAEAFDLSTGKTEKVEGGAITNQAPALRGSSPAAALSVPSSAGRRARRARGD